MAWELCEWHPLHFSCSITDPQLSTMWEAIKPNKSPIHHKHIGDSPIRLPTRSKKRFSPYGVWKSATWSSSYMITIIWNSHLNMQETKHHPHSRWTLIKTAERVTIRRALDYLFSVDIILCLFLFQQYIQHHRHPNFWDKFPMRVRDSEPWPKNHMQEAHSFIWHTDIYPMLYIGFNKFE